MIEQIAIESHLSLDDYAAFASLSGKVAALRSEAVRYAQPLRGRTIWMLSSTASGGGVAEMMPRVVTLLRELGVRTEWLVMRPREPAFFAFTKRLHNLLHGHGEGRLGADERALYERVSRQCADAARAKIARDDVIVVHDPQPLAMGAMLAADARVPLVWRCHVGTDATNAATTEAWAFLRPFVTRCDRALFSAPEYVREELADRSLVVQPTIDPLTHKNRELFPTKLVGILCNAGLLATSQPLLTAPFSAPALRLRSDGSFGPALDGHEIGIPYRPLITQISRWDPLKGFAQLIRAFVRLKQGPRLADRRNQRRRDIVRLVLAGPSADAVSDDPEASDTLAALAAEYVRLPASLQADIAIVELPMTSLKHNALMVNCLQRCSAIVAQNSLAEAFGLTATEAMWKAVPVVCSRASGLRHQVRDGVDGRLCDATDAPMLAERMEQMLADVCARRAWGRSAQKRVYDEYLIFRQIEDWLRVLGEVTRRQDR